MMDRKTVINALQAEFDVLVIGGGITGVGAARDAAYRGLKVALVEMHDLAYVLHLVRQNLYMVVFDIWRILNLDWYLKRYRNGRH